MTILGIDYGAKKIGLAISSEDQLLALPLEIISAPTPEAVLERLRAVCQEHQVERIVVGVPLSLKAEKRQTFWRQQDFQNQHMRDVLGFVRWLQTALALSVEVEDERLTTRQANRLGVRGQDDAVAAMLILQSYLDKQKGKVDERAS